MARATITHRIASRIRGLLGNKGMTQEELSELTGIPMRTLARRLHKTNPSSCDIEELDRIASALKVSIVSLFDIEQAVLARARRSDEAEAVTR